MPLLNPGIRTVLICGAGATFSDAAHRPATKQPPLDRGFFSGLEKAGGYNVHLQALTRYLERYYNLTLARIDSLEQVLGILYADIYNPALGTGPYELFLRVIRQFNRRVAQTTNALLAATSNIRKIMSRLLKGCRPYGLTVITFNQDIRIELALAHLHERAPEGSSRILNFPYCYKLPNCPTTQPSNGKVKLFPLGKRNNTGVAVLKLHGSLNWYSRHHSDTPSPKALLNPNRAIHITRRQEIRSDMRYTIGTSRKRRIYTFPMVVPPVVHKAGILHTVMAPVWQAAEKAIVEAERVIVFGYSCPHTDNESANMLRRAFRRNERLENLIVIDPSPLTFQRYIEVSGLNRLTFCESARAYLVAADELTP